MISDIEKSVVATINASLKQLRAQTDKDKFHAYMHEMFAKLGDIYDGKTQKVVKMEYFYPREYSLDALDSQLSFARQTYEEGYWGNYSAEDEEFYFAICKLQKIVERALFLWKVKKGEC